MKDEKTHVKQIGLKCTAEDFKHIEKIKKEIGFKYDSDAIRFALEDVAKRTEREIAQENRLTAIEEALLKNANSIDSISWRSNDTYLLLLSLANAHNVKVD